MGSKGGKPPVANKGLAAKKTTANKGTRDTYKKTTTTSPSGGGTSYSGGGGSGGGSGTDPKTTQATINVTQDMAKQKKGQLDDKAKDKFNAIKKTEKANNKALAEQNRRINLDIEWQPQQQKEQSTMMALRSRMGNSAYGSATQDLVEGMQRVDDMADVELINTYKQNMNNAYDDWYQAHTSIINDYNELATNMQDKYDDLQNQTWASLASIDPKLASKKNMAKSKKQAQTTSKKKAALKIAKSNASKQLKQLKTLKKQYKAALKSEKETKKKKSLKGKKGETFTTTAAQSSKSLKKKISKLSGKKVVKAYTKAKKAYAKAKAKKVTSGKGDEKFSLKQMNLDPSKKVNSLMHQRKMPSKAANPLLSGKRDYIRPERAEGKVWKKMGYDDSDTTFGTYDTESTMSDYLQPFRRRA